MLNHAHPIQLRALRLRRTPQMSARGPRLWPNLPITLQSQLAKQMAQLLRRMTSRGPFLMMEERHADRNHRE